MDLFRVFTTAIQTEKNSGIAFGGLGIFFLLFSVYLFLFSLHGNLLLPAKRPSLFAGLFITIGSYFYVAKINNYYHTNIESAKLQKQTFIKAEKQRVAKLNKGYKKYTKVYIAIAFISIGSIYFLRNNVLGGVAFVIFTFSFFTIFNEMYGAKHSDIYFLELSKYSVDH